MGRNLTRETVPSTAGCNPVGVWGGCVWWLRKMEEALRVLRGWSSRAAQPHCCSVSASLPAPAPTLLCFLSLGPHPCSLPAGLQQQPLIHDVLHALLASAPAPAQRHTAFSPTPFSAVRKAAEEFQPARYLPRVGGHGVRCRVHARAVFRPVHVKGDGLEAYGLSLTIGRATAP